MDGAEIESDLARLRAQQAQYEERLRKIRRVRQAQRAWWVLVLLAVYVPPLAEVLALAHPGAEGWTLILVASALPVLLAPLARYTARRVVPG